MKKVLVISVGLLFLNSCARFSTKQTDVRYDLETGKPSTSITTKASAVTFFAGKSALSNWKAQQTEGEQGAEVGQLDTEVTEAGTQLSVILEAVAKGVVEGMKP